jgi:hypothetical protein
MIYIKMLQQKQVKSTQTNFNDAHQNQKTDEKWPLYMYLFSSIGFDVMGHILCQPS